jgi:hydrophobe/amphiphile efflux-3 (HAE3) family protein
MGIRQNVDLAFATGARWITRHPWRTIAGVFLVIAFFVSQLQFIRFDASTEGFLHEDDPTLLGYNDFRDQFGRDDLIILALHPPEIFRFEFLELLRELHEQLEEEVPYLDEVTSLINARATRGLEGELIVEDLMEEWPESDADLAQLEVFVMSNPSYRDLLISRDGRFTTLSIRTTPYAADPTLDDLAAGFEDEEAEPGGAEGSRAFLTDAENSEVVDATEAIVESFRARGLEIEIAGSPVVTNAVKTNMRHDMLLFVRLTLLAIAVFLFVLFRRASAVFLPLIVVVLSLLSTIGLMGATGVALKLPTMILPSFLMAVAVGDSVHILALFYRSFDAGTSKQESIVEALEHSGLPVTLTSLTTAGGLLSFAPAELAPISDLGHFAPAGVIIAMLLSLTLLPALLAALPLRVRKLAPRSEADGPLPIDRVLQGAARLAVTRSWPIVICSAVIGVVSLIAAINVPFSHDPVKWLPATSSARLATETIDRQLRGSITTEIILERPVENAFFEPELLARVDEFTRQAEQYESEGVFIGRTFSAVDVLKEINRALHENDDTFYTIPDDRELVAQEFLLFENSGSDDLEDLVDSQFSKLRVTLKMPWRDAVAYSTALPELENLAANTMGEDVDIIVTGLMPLLMRTMVAVNVTMARSYLMAFVIITGLMMLLIGSVQLGLIAMIPNLIPIAMAMGVMWIFDMPLDTFTLMIASIALGLAVDDTIHFMHNYRRYREETGNSRVAIERTLDTAGRAMLFTTLVLATGFLIFTLSSMTNIFNFGLLTGFAIVMALVADFLLAPALMHLIHRRHNAGE